MDRMVYCSVLLAKTSLTWMGSKGSWTGMIEIGLSHRLRMYGDCRFIVGSVGGLRIYKC